MLEDAPAPSTPLEPNHRDDTRKSICPSVTFLSFSLFDVFLVYRNIHLMVLAKLWLIAGEQS